MMDPTTQSIVPEGADHGNPVSWQTIFFLLISLGSSTAMQPCGRVGGVPGRYTTYLRVSPIVCIVDAASVILYLILGFIFGGVSFKVLLLDILDRRFDEGGEPSITKETIFRWLWFVFGGLLPAIKLAALIGIPWSKAWGVMFLVSFVVTEALIVLQGYHSGRQSVFATHPSGAQNFNLSHGFATISLFAIFAQICVFWWANVEFLDRIFLGFNDSDTWSYGDTTYWHSTPERDVMLNMIISSSNIILPLVVLMMLALGSTHIWSTHASNRSKALQIGLGVFLGIGSAGLFAYSTYLIINMGRPSDVPIWYCLLLIPFWIFVWVLFYAIESIVHQWPKVGEYILPEQATALEEDDAAAGDMLPRILAVIFFLYHIFVTLFWYAFVYNPRWTYNTSWTKVFG